MWQNLEKDPKGYQFQVSGISTETLELIKSKITQLVDVSNEVDFNESKKEQTTGIVKFKRIEYAVLFNLVSEGVASPITLCKSICQNLTNLNNHIEASLSRISKFTVMPVISRFASPAMVNSSSAAMVGHAAVLATSALTMRQFVSSINQTQLAQLGETEDDKRPIYLNVSNIKHKSTFPECSKLPIKQQMAWTQIADNEIEIDNNGAPEKFNLAKLIKGLAKSDYILNQKGEEIRRNLALIEILVCLGECDSSFSESGLLKNQNLSEECTRLSATHRQLESALEATLTSNPDLLIPIRGILIAQSTNHPDMQRYVTERLHISVRADSSSTTSNSPSPRAPGWSKFGFSFSSKKGFSDRASASSTASMRPAVVPTFKLWNLDALRKLEDDDYASCEITDAEYTTHLVLTKQGKLKREEKIEFTVTTTGDKKTLKAQKKHIPTIMKALQGDIIATTSHQHKSSATTIFPSVMAGSPGDPPPEISEGARLILAVQKELERHHVLEFKTFTTDEMKPWGRMLNDNVSDQKKVSIKNLKVKHGDDVRTLTGIIDFLQCILLQLTVDRYLVYVEENSEASNPERDKFLYKKIVAIFFQCFATAEKLFSLSKKESLNTDVNTVIDKFNDIAKMLVQIDNNPNAKTMGFKLADLDLGIKSASLTALYMYVENLTQPPQRVSIKPPVFR